MLSRRVLLVAIGLLASWLVAATSSARTPTTCRRCRSGCDQAVSQCLAATTCPAAPRRKAHRCFLKAKRRCRKTTTARCIATCQQTGSPSCGATSPAACGPYTSTCPAVPPTPVTADSAFSDQLNYDFFAHTASPGPGSCCVIDECAGTTQVDTEAGNVSLFYHEVEYLDPTTHVPTNGSITTKIGVSCPVGIPSDVYARSDIYRVNFAVDLPFALPPGPPVWSAPYVESADGLSISIKASDDPHASDRMNSFTPPTWRFVEQTVSVDKICPEQDLMQGHATASFIKNDGTPCTVTIYAQGTRAVAGQ